MAIISKKHDAVPEWEAEIEESDKGRMVKVRFLKNSKHVTAADLTAVRSKHGIAFPYYAENLEERIADQAERRTLTEFAAWAMEDHFGKNLKGCAPDMYGKTNGRLANFLKKRGWKATRIAGDEWRVSKDLGGEIKPPKRYKG